MAHSGDHLSIYVVAGEPSGDHLGGKMAADLKSAFPNIKLFGVGGPELAEQGLSSLFDMADLSVMGVVDVLKSAPRLLWRAHQVISHILSEQPDLVVLIDSQLFSLHVASALKKKGFNHPVVLYVAPTVWLYAPERAEKYVGKFDEIWAILPFEPKALRDLHGPHTVYVGHPAVAPLPDTSTQVEAKEANYLAIYPGSRHGELTRQLPLFKKVVEQMVAAGHRPQLFIPTLPHLVDRLTRATLDWPIPVEIVADRAKRTERLEATRLALVTSGTATLELAMAGVPMVVSYVMDHGQARKHKTLTDFRAALPSIVLSETVVPEFIQPAADPAPITDEVSRLWTSAELREQQLVDFARVRAAFLAPESGTGLSAPTPIADRIKALIRPNA